VNAFRKNPIREPDAGNPHVRFDERGRETGLHDGLRHRLLLTAAGQQLLPIAAATAPVLDSTDFSTSATTANWLKHRVLRLGSPEFHLEPAMANRSTIRLPRQWPRHVKSGILHAISLASVVVSFARGHAAGRHRLQAKLEQADAEIALLREELSI